MSQIIDQNEYEPYGAALDLFHSHDREILIEGPAGTGKTRAILEKVHILALKQPGVRILFVRKTRKSLSESVLTTFEEVVLPPGFKRLWSGSRRAYRDKYTYPNGSEIILGGMDNPVHLFSTEFDIICVFEATELTEDEYESLHRALRHKGTAYRQVMADCNPSYPSHWLIRRALEGRMRHLPSRHEDNPSLTPDYMETLKALTGLRHDRLYRGVWIAAEGAVWPEYDVRLHLINRVEIPNEWRRFRSIDFGYALDHAFVCQWWAMDGGGKLYRYRELYGVKRTVRHWAEQINGMSHGEEIEFTLADHDAEDRATLNEHGIYTTPADKRVIAGIEAVADCLAGGTMFLLHDSLILRDPVLDQAKRPCCTEEEIEGYLWHKAPDGSLAKEAPDKNCPDHGCDAMRYLVLYLSRRAGAAIVSGNEPTKREQAEWKRDDRDEAEEPDDDWEDDRHWQDL